MNLVIDRAVLVEEVRKNTQYIAKDVKRAQTIPITREVLSTAAPIIETLLKSAASLPSKGGLKQFYDTQSDIAKSAKGWKIPKNTKDPHLIEMWKVDWEMHMKEGEGKIVIDNDKMVAGREQMWSLLRILWEGTDYYVAPVTLSQEEIARLSRQRDSSGTPLMKKWTRDKEKYFINITRGMKLRAKKKVARAKGKAAAVPQSAVKTHEQWMKEKWQFDQAGQDSFSMKVGGYDDEDDMEEGQVVFYHQKATTALQTSPWIRPTGVKGVVEFVKKKMSRGKMREDKSKGKWGKKVPYVHGEIWDVSGGDTSYHQQPAQYMHFYNRFKGRFYYNQLVRKGIEGEVLQDFHDYVSGCVMRGMELALGQISDETVEDIYNMSRLS